MGFWGDLLFDILDFAIEESRHQEVISTINKNSTTHTKAASQRADLEKRIAAVEAENKALKRKLEKVEKDERNFGDPD